MNQQRIIRSLATLLFCLSICNITSAQDTTAVRDNLNDWLDERIKTLVLKVRINQRNNTNQTETSAISNNSTSLVDQSKASDLIGVALNVAGITGASNDKTEANSVLMTATAYSFYSAFKGADPLDPTFYNNHQAWRRVIFTLGYEKEEMKDGTETTDRATLTGIKLLLVNHRDVSDIRHQAQLNTVFNHLRNVAAGFANLSREIRVYLFLNSEIVKTLRTEEELKSYVTTELQLAQSMILEFKRDIGLTDNDLRILEEKSSTELVREVNELTRRRREIRQQIQAASGTEKSTLENQEAALTKRTRVIESIDRQRELQDLKGELDAGKHLEEVFNSEKSDEWNDVKEDFFQRFREKHFSRTGFPVLLATLGTQIQSDIDQLIERRLEPFLTLDQASCEAVETIRKGLQVSVAGNSKTKKEGDNEYSGEFIIDKGVLNRLNFTFNASFNYKDSKSVGADVRIARAAYQLQFQITPEKSLFGRDPIYFDLGGEHKWMSGSSSDWIHKVQGKLRIPITEGVTFPISFTFSNRTELIDEKDVRGQFGFTFDLARLAKSFGFR